MTSKIAWRIVPLLALCYLVSFIDKTNIGFAQLGMQSAVGISDAAFGLGAGVFFVGYFLFEVPSNLALARFGARRWIARIMLTWGVLVVVMIFVRGPVSFTVLRFLLGVAEAGFYPGVLYYLSKWVPGRERTKLVGLLILANPVSTVVGGPICGALLELDGWLGLSGWQWMFIVTGVPAVVLAAVVLRFLPESPDRARWLSADERAWLHDALAAEESQAQVRHRNPLRALTDPKVLFLAAFFAAFPTAAYGLRLWLPTLVKSFHVSDFANGVLNAVPFAFAAVALVIWPRVAGRGRHLHRHLVAATLLGAAGLVATALATSLALQLVLLSITAVGMFAAQPMYWSLPSRLLLGANAAAGLALINSVGNLGGFVGPYVVGAIKSAGGGLRGGMFFLAAVMLYAAVMAVVSARRLRVDEPAAVLAERR
ncbi:MFS transporter [Amycolatopsis sp. NPDC051903]|uniref:MFS transporter n=1 Tax=Amycolatopsis sp. NPDC051903 TaxID=3363936 RepID=UPI0037A97980